MSYIHVAGLTLPCFPAPAPAGLIRGAPSVRAEHAHLLNIAAARRRRAKTRRDEDRLDDAGYWKACAPFALRKAAALRPRLSPLP